MQPAQTVVVRVPSSLRERVWLEAAALGVDPSALIRGVLTVYLQDVATGKVVLGGSVCIVKLERAAMAELRIPRRQRRTDDG